jgi:hypothetical protein
MRATRPRVGLFTHAVLVAIPITIAIAVGCSSGDDGEQRAAGTTDTTAVEDVVVDADDFKPLADMTPVRGFFVDNLAGNLDGTLAVANDPEGGTYRGSTPSRTTGSSSPSTSPPPAPRS